MALFYLVFVALCGNQQPQSLRSLVKPAFYLSEYNYRVPYKDCFRHKIGTVLLLFSSTCALFILAESQVQKQISQQLHAELEGRSILVRGQLQSRLEQTADTARFEFFIEDAQLVQLQDDIRGQVSKLGRDQALDQAIDKLRGHSIRLSWRTRRALALGQRWQFYVRLKAPRSLVNHRGFDYQAWLLSKHSVATGYVFYFKESGVPRLLSDKKTVLAQLRTHIEHLLQPWSERAILKALVLGDRSELTSVDWRMFRDTGTVHLMAISGLHVGLVAALCLCSLRWLLRPLLLLLSLSVYRFIYLSCTCYIAWLYAYLAGLASPTLRAFLALVLLQLCFLLGRHVKALDILVIIAALMLFINPMAATQPGFVLSFSAALSLLLVFSFRENKPLNADGSTADASAALSVSVDSTFYKPASSNTETKRLSIREQENKAVLTHLLKNTLNKIFNTKTVSEPSALNKGNKYIRYLLDLLTAQMLLWLVLLPLLLFFFLPVSFFAPIANFIVVPFMALIIMPLIFGAVLVSVFSVDFAMYVLAAANQCVYAQQRLLQWVSHYTNPFFIPDAFYSFIACSAFVCALIVLVLSFKPRMYVMRLTLVCSLLFMGLISLACAVVKSPLWPDSKAIELEVLDAGQGLSVFLNLENNHWVYDLGARFSDSFSIAMSVLYPMLERKQVVRLNNLLISHADADHAGAFTEFVQTLEVDQILSGEAAVLAERLEQTQFKRAQLWQASQTEFINMAQGRAPKSLEKLKLSSCLAGMLVDTARWRMDVLWPNTTGHIAQANDRSCVLLLTLKHTPSGSPKHRLSVLDTLGFDAEIDINMDTKANIIRQTDKELMPASRILFMGDVSSKVEEQLLASEHLSQGVDILIAGHHGSASSSSIRFLAHLQPKHLIISSGFRNRYGHPSEKVLNRAQALGIKVWNTAWHGALNVVVKEGAISLISRRCSQWRRWYRDEGFCP
ncbi:ComEC/Rec2 family competence protein [Agaribacterium sp. ZY112]|uniref:ComEC/Rec2 family competence protein n=1 Tax=Agaribacterium sp. ZY112 TaxID=3233574 RepID=UPI003525358C